MKEDNRTRIVIAQPKTDVYILPAISSPSYQQSHPSQTEFYRSKIRKLREY